RQQRYLSINNWRLKKARERNLRRSGSRERQEIDSVFTYRIRGPSSRGKNDEFQGREKCVLLVEDDKGAQELMTSMLTGYEIVVARDCSKGAASGPTAVFRSLYNSFSMGIFSAV